MPDKSKKRNGRDTFKLMDEAFNNAEFNSWFDANNLHKKTLSVAEFELHKSERQTFFKEGILGPHHGQLYLHHLRLHYPNRQKNTLLYTPVPAIKHAAIRTRYTPVPAANAADFSDVVYDDETETWYRIFIERVDWEEEEE